MLVVDNILLSPVRGFLWIVRELHNAAQQEAESRSDALTQRLSTLYMELETGRLTPDEFDRLEREVLDELDELSSLGESDDSDHDEDQDDEDHVDDHDDDEDHDTSVDDAGELEAADRDDSSTSRSEP